MLTNYCCCCCYSYNNTSNSITEKLSNLSREVNSSESLAWRANQLCRNLGWPSYTHSSSFSRRCWYGFWRQSKGAEVITSWLSECVQLRYLASHVAEPPMREKNTEYAGSGFPPSRSTLCLKPAKQMQWPCWLFHLKRFLSIISLLEQRKGKIPKTPPVTHYLLVFLIENSILIACLTIT